MPVLLASSQIHTTRQHTLSFLPAHIAYKYNRSNSLIQHAAQCIAPRASIVPILHAVIPYLPMTLLKIQDAVIPSAVISYTYYYPCYTFWNPLLHILLTFISSNTPHALIPIPPLHILLAFIASAFTLVHNTHCFTFRIPLLHRQSPLIPSILLHILHVFFI